MLLLQIAKSNIDQIAVEPPTQSPTPEILTALRSVTASAHRRLHHHPGLYALVQGKLTRPDYICLLLRMLGLHDTIERRLAAYKASPWLAWYVHPSSASRSLHLRNDLEVLGLPRDEIAAAALADEVLPPWANAAEALGCSWVVEGSAQGGRVLARQAEAAWPGAASFFTPDPEQDQRWQLCRAASERCGADSGRRAALLAGAATTFEAYETWLGGTQ